MNISLWTTVLALALILTLASEIQLVSEQTLFNTRSDKAANLVRMHIENNHNRLLLITNISATDWNDKDSSFYLLKPFIRKQAYSHYFEGFPMKGYSYFKYYKRSEGKHKSVAPQTDNTEQIARLYQVVLAILRRHADWLHIRLDDNFILTLDYDATTSQEWLSYVNCKFSPPEPQASQFSNVPTNLNLQTSFVNASKTITKASEIQRKLYGTGLHQKVNLTLFLTEEVDFHIDPLSCSLVWTEILPETTYIDSDQLHTSHAYEIINVEHPSYLAKQYFVTINVPFHKFGETGIRQYSYIYPINFRYPRPSKNQYTIVPLHPVESLSIQCKEGQGVKDYKVHENKWHDRGAALIPNGDQGYEKTVSMITFVSALLFAMFLVKQLKKYD